MRLVGGSSPLEGRVEVCYFNQWGTICSDSWGPNEAGVICSQVGYDRTGEQKVHKPAEYVNFTVQFQKVPLRLLLQISSDKGMVPLLETM